jgi:hypothetical protein
MSTQQRELLEMMISIRFVPELEKEGHVIDCFSGDSIVIQLEENSEVSRSDSFVNEKSRVIIRSSFVEVTDS